MNMAQTVAHFAAHIAAGVVNGKEKLYMMKRGKAGCKRVLCWLLTAAMVMTGSSVPGLETKAASATNTVTQTAEGEESSTGTEIKETESEGISEEDSREEISAEESSEEETLSEEPSSDHTQEETSKEDDSEPESETKSAEEETETEIMLLQEDETAESIEATLYYYIGKTDKEVGVVAWNDKVSYGDTAAKAEWTPWTGTDCYLMTKLEYAGWYSIDLVFADAQTASGFEIFTAAKSEDGTYAPGSSSIYKCSKEYEGNEVYAKLISKESSSYAVKGDKLYTDIDDITILQRNITLYVYDKEGTPAIMASQPISAVDETTGTISEMTADHTESWGYFYDMASDETASDWYYLTFSVPKADTGEKTCQLYQKTASDTYDWIKNFINGGTPDEWSVDITPVFSGNIYYKDGEFSDTRSTTSGHEEQAEINVEKVALPDDFITGADLSSYISLVESGVVFKDKDGNALDNTKI